MKKYLLFVLITLIIVLLTGGFLGWKYYKNKKMVSELSTSSSVQSTPSLPTAPTPTSITEPAPTYVYPISNFTIRAMTNLLGTYYIPGGSINPDRSVCPNATYYSGYHTAADLEATASEADQNVPVFAIATGSVRQVSVVSGYGGLIIVQYNLGGTDYTAYYGHIDLATTKVKSGGAVSVGETLASLGAACSTSNGNVRKHLHFGLHKGTAIDVRGYVPNQSDLSSWVDPKELLESLAAN